MNRNRTTDSYVKFNENGNIFHRQRVEGERQKMCCAISKTKPEINYENGENMCRLGGGKKKRFCFQQSGNK